MLLAKNADRPGSAQRGGGASRRGRRRRRARWRRRVQRTSWHRRPPAVPPPSSSSSFSGVRSAGRVSAASPWSVTVFIVAAGALARHTERVGRLVHAVRLRFRLHLRCHTCEQLGRALPDAVHSRHGWHALRTTPRRRCVRRRASRFEETPTASRATSSSPNPGRPCGRPRARRHPLAPPPMVDPSPPDGCDHLLAPPWGALPRRQAPEIAPVPLSSQPPPRRRPFGRPRRLPAAVRAGGSGAAAATGAFPGWGARGWPRSPVRSRPTQHAPPRRRTRRRPRVWRSARGLRHPPSPPCSRWSD